MVKFLNTTATNYYLEELIKQSRQHLYIISPFLQFNDKIKELLEDRNRYKVEIRLVFGKSELAPQEINWLRTLEYVRTGFCRNLHAKCYLSEDAAIITSMNLYNFSQVNNNEMGVYIVREEEPELYNDTYEEAHRLFRISEQVRLSAEKVEESEEKEEELERKDSSTSEYDKLTTSKLAKSLGKKTAEVSDRLLAKGLLQRDGDQFKLTDAGKKAGGEVRVSQKYGRYFIWPKDLTV